MRRKEHQELTYWGPGVLDDYNESAWPAPILVMGHWEDRSEQVRKPSGEEIVSKSVVYVDRPLEEGGFLVKGDYATSALGDPTAAGASEIQATMEIPSLRTNQSEYRAIL